MKQLQFITFRHLLQIYYNTMLLAALLMLLFTTVEPKIDGAVFTKIVDDLARDSLGVQEIQVSALNIHTDTTHTP